MEEWRNGGMENGKWKMENRAVMLAVAVSVSNRPVR